MARILVVDDAIDNLAVMKNHLETGGHHVETSCSAEEALGLIDLGRRFDMFVLDVVLPGLSGFELCDRLRESRETETIPILFVTGERAELPDRIQGFERGASDYLTKPVARAELLARIEVLLRLRQALSDAQRNNEELARIVDERTGALREALASLERQRNLLETLVHTLPALVIATDASGRIVRSNAETEKVCGPLEDGVALERTLLQPFCDEQQWGESGTVLHWIHDVHGERRLFEAERTEFQEDPLLHLFHIVDVTEREKLLHQGRDREVAGLLEEIELLKTELHGHYRMSDFVGISPEVARVHTMVNQLRNRHATVLLRGESGTGKDLVARAIHYDGTWSDQPFVPVHCGAIPPSLAESEFFGHVKGAFTGADKDSPGLFMQAEGGTLFLDEISECTLEVQGKLLRVLQSGEMRPVGGTTVRRVNTRLIAATNKDLWQLVEEGRFREDLLFRLDVISMEIPPLRDRPDDIPVLAIHLLKKQALKTGRANEFKGISSEAMRVLESHHWPGNVRELENVFIRAAALAPGPIVQVEDLPDRLERLAVSRRAGHGASNRPSHLQTESPVESDVPLTERRRRAESEAIVAALRRTRGNKKAAADLLGIGKSSLYRKLKEFGIGEEELEAH